MLTLFVFLIQTMVNPGSSSQPPPVTSGSLSWKRCAGCGGKIADRFLLYAMDGYWHSRCLKCSCCQAQLGEIGTSCYTKSGMILCRNDYIRWARWKEIHVCMHVSLCVLLFHFSRETEEWMESEMIAGGRLKTRSRMCWKDSLSFACWVS